MDSLIDALWFEQGLNISKLSPLYYIASAGRSTIHSNGEDCGKVVRLGDGEIGE